MTLLGLLVLPWIWSLPIALMTAELGSMIPEAGGYVVWIHRAFGPFWAHQNAVWNLVANAFDNALYPVMFVDYLRYFPAFRHLTGLKRWLVSVSMLTSVTGLNLLGVDGAFAALAISAADQPTAHAMPLASLPLSAMRSAAVVVSSLSTTCASMPAADALLPHPPTHPPTPLLPFSVLPSMAALWRISFAVVASASNVFAALVIAPFAALVVIGLPSLNAAALTHPFDRPIRWGTYLSVLLWNTSGYDSVGALAAEVHRPGRDFPRAMVATILMVTLVYVLPLCVAISLDHTNLARWTDGHFTKVAQEHVGDWLSAWISIGGALSAVGLLNTLLCTAARVTVSSARLRVVPPCLATLDERGLPRRATIVLALVLAFACALPFAELISISMLFYGATTAFEFAALLVLRRSEPDTPRPFRIPVTRQWLPVAAAPPVMLCLLLICLAPREAWVIFILSIAVGLGTFFLAHGCTMKAAEACWKPHLAADAAFDLGDERDASHPQGVVAPTGGSGRAGSGNGSGRAQREGRSSAGRASSASAGVVPRFLFQGSGQSSGGYGKLRTVERRSHEGAAVELFGDESVDDPPSPLAAATAAEVTHPKKGGRRGRAGAGASEEGRGGGGLGGNNAGSTNGSAELSIAVAEVDAPPSAPGSSVGSASPRDEEHGTLLR